MLRSVGALIFGAFADRYGRKWPMVIDLALITILELGSSFCQTLPQFLAVRSLFGIAMGGRSSNFHAFGIPPLRAPLVTGLREPM
jgi:SHS family lactate transporter-like MFS transporter